MAVLWLVLLALPLSGFAAWLAAGALTRRRWIRVVAGLAWAGAPMLLMAMGQGRLGALLVHVLLPLVMLGLIRAVGAAVGSARSLAAQALTATLHGRQQLRPGWFLPL